MTSYYLTIFIMKLANKFYLLSIVSLVLFLAGAAKAAAAEITIKEASLISVNTADKYFIASVGDTPFKFAYDNFTKTSGTPGGLTPYTDWVAGALVSVTGTTAVYDAGVLKLNAKIIHYLNKDIKINTITGILENKTSEGKKIYLSYQKGNLYTLLEVANVGQANGPRLAGVSSFDALEIGSKISVMQAWRAKPLPETKIKDLVVNKLTDRSAKTKRVVSIGTSNDNLVIEANYQQPVTLRGNDTLILQNNTATTLYLKAALADRTKFQPALPNSFITIKPKSRRSLTIKAGAVVGVMSLPFRDVADEQQPPKVTITLDIWP